MNLDQLLNPKQKAAATYLDSHCRIIAGAGSADADGLYGGNAGGGGL